MAYNSDGYIMIDFAEVDFRRTNQTIEGLYKRCVDVIGTNKFILVINANGKSPLPSVCSFVNNQYVIESCIYTFAITSADLIIIKRNDPSGIIDDTVIASNKTWSSYKIDSDLNTKVDASALADYQPVLTPVSPISISEDDELSVDLSDYQPLLTAGDNINIDNNVISANSGFSDYSTTEHVVGTWTDGSPVYEKTFEFTNPQAGNAIKQHNISNFDKIISVMGSFHRDDGYEEPVPYPTTDVRFIVSLVDFTSTNMTMVVGSIYAGTYKLRRVSFTIRYTKTSTE